MNLPSKTLINSENGKPLEGFAPKHPPVQSSSCSTPVVRKTIEEAAAEYIERSKQKGHKTYLGYRNAADLFLVRVEN
jgi:hypothetical protein